MGVHVAPKICGMGKGSATVCGRKGGHATVHDLLVLMEPRALAEAEATVSTTVRLLPSVDTEVGSQGRVLCKVPPTVRTTMRPLPSVYSPVSTQRCE